MKTKDTVIKFSKIKTLGLLSISLIFVTFGIWIAFFAPEVSLEFLNNEVFRKSIGFLSILFFGGMAILISKMLFENKWGIKIDENGIYDTSNLFMFGLIPWENINQIVKKRVFTEKIILIEVDNPNEYIDKQKNFFFRMGAKMNNKKYGSPIIISANALKIRYATLFTALKNEYDKRKLN